MSTLKTNKQLVPWALLILIFGLGLATIEYLSPVVCSNMAALRALTPNASKPAIVLGYYTPGDGGGGTYVLTNSIVGTNAYGGKVLSTLSGWSWQLQTDGKTTSRQWGIEPGTITESMVSTITNMIAWNAEKGLKTVLSTGVYDVETNIWMVSNTILEGEPNSIWRRKFALQSRYDKALFSIKDAPRPDPPSELITEVTVVATNIVIRDLTVMAAATNYVGPLISLCGVYDARVEGVTVLQGAYDYSMTLFGHNISVTGNNIRSVLPGVSSTVYTDGIHVLGGTNGIISNNLIETGDDNIALTMFGNVGISDWVITGNTHLSWRGHAIRLQAERDYSTNQVSNIVIQGGVGQAGILQNSGITSIKSATNSPYPFKNISIKGFKLQMGGLQNHIGGVPNGQAAGVFMESVDGLLLEDVQVSPTPYQSFYIYRSKNVTMQNCTGEGGQYTSFNSTVRIENCGDVKVIGGRFSTVTNNTPTVLVVGVSNATFIGTHMVNDSATQNVFQASGTQSGLISLVGCTLTNSGPGLLFVTNPERAVLVANHVVATTGAAWQASTPPVGAIIDSNYGISALGSYTGLGFNVLNSGGTAYIGGLDVRANNQTRIMNTNGFIILSQDTVNGGTKALRFGAQPSASANNPNIFMVSSDGGSFPTMTLNGGSASGNGHRWVFLSAAASDYTPATVVGLWNNNGFRFEAGAGSSPTSDSYFDVASTTKGSRPFPSMTGDQWGAIIPAGGGLFAYDTTRLTPWVTTGVSTNWQRQLLPYVISQADSDVTLVSNSAIGSTYKLADASSNRTVTLPSAGIRNGDKIHFVRPVAANAFTWIIGSAVTLPASTKAWATVQYDGAAWVAVQYGTIP